MLVRKPGFYALGLLMAMLIVLERFARGWHGISVCAHAAVRLAPFLLSVNIGVLLQGRSCGLERLFLWEHGFASAQVNSQILSCHLHCFAFTVCVNTLPPFLCWTNDLAT